MALQEYLASYAVRVDEDGARRLQRILDRNRTSAAGLAETFTAARKALEALKKELSGSAGLRDVFSAVSSGSRSAAGLSAAHSASAGSSGSSGLSPDALRGSLSSLSLSGAASLSVSADLSAAEEALNAFRAKAEALRPKLNVNASGITSAVSSAIASVRAMLSSVSVTIPVKAKATLDTSGLSASGSSSGSSSRSSGSGGSSGTGGSKTSGGKLSSFGAGGRVGVPTLAMIAEEGEPEYVIPVRNESRALPLLRALLAEMSAAARVSLIRTLREKDGLFSVRSASSPAEAAPSPSASGLSDRIPSFPAALTPVFLPPADCSFPDSFSSALRSVLSDFLPPSGGQPAEGFPSAPDSMAASRPLSEAAASPEPFSAASAAVLSDFSAEADRILRALSSRTGAVLPDRFAFSGAGASGSPEGASSGFSGLLSAVLPETSALLDFPARGSDFPDLSSALNREALSGLRETLSLLTEAARSGFAAVSAPAPSVSHSVSAPVSISVISAAAQPEAVGRFIYDTARRGLLKTLEGVFA